MSGIKFQVSSVELASPECECQKVDGETKDAQGCGVEEQPVWFCAEGDVAELVDLIKGKRKGEESGRKQIEGDVDSRHGKHKNIGEQHKDVMKRHDTFPAEAREKCDTLIFLVLRKGLEIEHDEKGKRQKREWQCER